MVQLVDVLMCKVVRSL